MKSLWRVVVIGILAIIGINIALKLLGTVFSIAFNLVVPGLILVGICYAIYSLGNKKALGESKNRFLP